MRSVFLLFRKDILCAFSAFRQKGRRRDVAGWISTILLLAGIFAAFVYAFYVFAESYRSITFDTPEAEADRVYELLTFSVGAVLVVQCLIGVKKIYDALTDVKDQNVLICQPVRAEHIYLYKILRIYWAQLLSAVLILVPVAVITDVLSGYAGGAAYYGFTALAVLLTPFLSCAAASLLAVPYTFFMRFLENKYLLRLLLYILLIGAAFWVYGRILLVITTLLDSGKLEFVFELQTMERIHAVAARLYPAAFLTKAVFGADAALNLLWAILLCAGLFLPAYFLIRIFYRRALQARLEGESRVFRRRNAFRRRSKLASLLHKEFILVLRTPSYAFQYLATSVTVPFMVYQCVSLMRAMMSKITILDCDYELAVFAVAVFSIIGNTFCTTNISRDGRMGMFFKTLPVTPKEIVTGKLLFCGAVSVLSMVIVAVVLGATGLLTPLEVTALFFVGVIVSLAEIAAATRKDLSSPVFPTQDNDEVTDSNSNVSLIMLLGLLFAFLAGAGSVLISTLMSIYQIGFPSFVLSTAFILVVAAAACILSFVYLFRGLDEKYRAMEESL